MTPANPPEPVSPANPPEPVTLAGAEAPSGITSSGGFGPEVVIVGGGITGLATAWFLRHQARVTVLEAGGRLGGKIRTESFQGVPVEAGPDTFLAREPEAVGLCRELGLGDDLVAPANSKAWLWSRGTLARLPEPHALGVPLELWPLLKSGLISYAGVARAALDLVGPRLRSGDDPSVAEVIGRRLGREVLDRLVEPLVGGINAGYATNLSLASTAPPLSAAAEGRSLLLALRRQRRASSIHGRPGHGTPGDQARQGPLFLGLSGGLERLVERLGAGLRETGVTLRTGVSVSGIEHGGSASGSAVRVVCEDGTTIDADAVVLTVPAFAAAKLLAAPAPEAAAGLATIVHASVSVITLAYQPNAVPTYLDGAGFLVPRVDGRLITACTWTTSKWPELRRSGLVLLRASAARAGDTRAMALHDDALTQRVHGELAQALELGQAPVASLITRWPQAFPQYQPGHAFRVGRIEADLARELPAVTLAGASYWGVGITACIRQARAAAARLLPGTGRQ